MRSVVGRQCVRAAAVFLVVGLAGCATAAQREVQQAGTVTREALAQFKGCMAAVWAKPDYASLLPHSPAPGAGQPTMAQLTDETVPTVEEAHLLAARFDDDGPCKKSLLASLSTARPDLVPILANAYSKGAEIIAQLVERKITWAASMRQAAANESDVRTQIAAADQQWLAGLRAENHAELARRQAAGEALMQWSQQQQMINAINRPVVTNCDVYGATASCVSH